MISDFSSLIELFAAIYLTITVDDLLLRRFWTPDYTKKLEVEMFQIKMPSLVKRSTIDKASCLSSYEENRSRKRGAIMFGLSVILLVVIGFDGYFKSLGDFGQSVLLSLLVLVILIIYFFNDCLLKSWWSVLISLIIVPFFIGLTALFLPMVNGYAEMVKEEHVGYVLATRLFIVSSLILPVLWQLMRNWIYTKYYLGYIIGQTKDKANDYNDALRYDHTKQKVRDVATEYHDAVLQVVAAGNGDRQITPFLDILKDNLAKIEYVPTLLPLLKYSYLSYKKNHISNCRLKKLYKKYKTISPAPKMEKFCNDEGISYDKFKSYHLKQIGRG